MIRRASLLSLVLVACMAFLLQTVASGNVAAGEETKAYSYTAIVSMGDGEGHFDAKTVLGTVIAKDEAEAKRKADGDARKKVTVPSGWFITLVTVTIIGPVAHDLPPTTDSSANSPAATASSTSDTPEIARGTCSNPSCKDFMKEVPSNHKCWVPCNNPSCKDFMKHVPPDHKCWVKCNNPSCKDFMKHVPPGHKCR